MLCSLIPRAGPAALAACGLIHYSMAVTLSGDAYNTLQDYHPPSWAQHIKPQPSQYVQVDLLSHTVLLYCSCVFHCRSIVAKMPSI